ncbi:hypothetical protein D3C84_770760 [compost metagenome]
MFGFNQLFAGKLICFVEQKLRTAPNLFLHQAERFAAGTAAREQLRPVDDGDDRFQLDLRIHRRLRQTVDQLERIRGACRLNQDDIRRMLVD